MHYARAMNITRPRLLEYRQFAKHCSQACAPPPPPSTDLARHMTVDKSRPGRQLPRPRLPQAAYIDPKQHSGPQMPWKRRLEAGMYLRSLNRGIQACPLRGGRGEAKAAIRGADEPKTPAPGAPGRDGRGPSAGVRTQK